MKVVPIEARNPSVRAELQMLRNAIELVELGPPESHARTTRLALALLTDDELAKLGDRMVWFAELLMLMQGDYVAEVDARKTKEQ